nr:MAG TPA: hypothetical protein [Caudoviricetes sp.]
MWHSHRYWYGQFTAHKYLFSRFGVDTTLTGLSADFYPHFWVVFTLFAFLFSGKFLASYLNIPLSMRFAHDFVSNFRCLHFSVVLCGAIFFSIPPTTPFSLIFVVFFGCKHPFYGLGYSEG